MNVRFNVKGYIDRRTPAQIQSYDSILIKRWRWRVQRRLEGRPVESEWSVSLERRLGRMGPNRQGSRA